MRITRSKMRQEYKSRSMGLTVVFIILLPILSIYLGYTAFKMLIVPNMQPKEVSQQSNNIPPKQTVSQNQNNSAVNPAEEETEEAFATTFELKGFDFYGIQIGKFSTVENAENMKTALKTKGYEGYIYQQDGYKVITLLSLSRGGIDVGLEKIRKDYPDAYVSSMNIPAQQIKYAKDDGKNTLSIESQHNKLLDILMKMSEQGEQLIKENVDAERVKTVADENIIALESIKSELSNIATSSNIKELNQGLIKIIDLGIARLNKVKESGAIVDYQGALSEIFFGYMTFSTNGK